jgi:hypothetical protein
MFLAALTSALAWRPHARHRNSAWMTRFPAAQQDVDSAFEFGGAVVAGEDGGAAAQQGDLAGRQPVQAEAE